jgi:hypothetical protein
MFSLLFTAKNMRQSHSRKNCQFTLINSDKFTVPHICYCRFLSLGRASSCPAPSPLSPSATCSAAGSTYIQLPLPLLATGAVSTSHRPELPSDRAPDTRRLSRRAPVQLEASSSGVVADSPRTWIIAGKQFTSTQSSEIKTSKKYSHQTGNFGCSVAAHSPLRVGITIAMVGHPDALHRQRAPSAVRSGAPSKEASSMMEKPPRPGRRG